MMRRTAAARGERSSGGGAVAGGRVDGRDRRACRRAGFSLLEVILALAILGGAVAVCSELARVGIESARIARELTYAQLLCESKMAEILAGIEPLEPVAGVPFETTAEESEADWLYSIEITPLDDQGLTAVRVTVYKEMSQDQRPITFFIDRWILDSQTATVEGATGESLVPME